MFPVLSVAKMRCWFVHCPTTLTTFVLSIFGVFIAVFLIAHTQMRFSNYQRLSVDWHQTLLLPLQTYLQVCTAYYHNAHPLSLE